MGYVTEFDYKQLMHTNEVPDDFDKLVELAGEYLDNLTSDYYQLHDIDHDCFPLRVLKFKRAMIRQIAYMAETGITTTQQYKQKNVASESNSVGGVSVNRTYGDNYANKSGTIVCDDALNALSGVGLLYRGVMHT